MPFSVIYPHSAFVGLGGNKVKLRPLVRAVKTSVSIPTELINFRIENPGSGSTPEVDDTTDRTWAFIFAGSGPLPGGEKTALDAIVAAHSGVDDVDTTIFTMPSGAEVSLGPVTLGQVIVRTSPGVFSGVDMPVVGGVQYVEVASPSQTVTSSVYTNVDGMNTLTTVSGGIYIFSGVINFSMSTTTGTPSVNMEGSFSDLSLNYSVPKSTTSTMQRQLASKADNADSTSITILAGTVLPYEFAGRFTATGDGTIAVRIKRLGSGTLTIAPYSRLRLERVG